MRFSSRSLAAVLIAAGVASCTDTRTINSPIPPGKHAAKLALNPVFSPAAKTISAALGDFGITFDHVRIRIRNNPDTNSVVADTTIAFGPTTSSLTLDLTVPVDADGQIFNALVEYTGPTGVVFSGTILVQSHSPDEPAPEQQSLVLNFVGPGAKLKTITLAPKPVSLVGTQSVPVTITATDSSGASLAVPPLVFTSSNATVATISGSATTFNAQSFGKRGQALLIATTPTGVADTVNANVTLPAAKIVLVSGGDQTGTVGTALTNPAVVQVNASDDIGVPGVSVTFAAPVNGSVGAATVTTDANGRASTTLTLATTAGPQSFLATAASFPLAINATAAAGPISAAQTLITATSPILADNVTASVVTVQARDQYQNLIKTGGATIGLTTTLGHFGTGKATTIAATDKGDGTYTAQLFSSVGGTTTISGTVASTAITSTATVTFVAGTLDHFDVTKTDGTAIGPTVQSRAAFPVKITARDAANNVIPSFTGQPKIRVTNSFFFQDSVITAPTAVSGVTTANVTLDTPGQNVTLDVTGTLGPNTVVSHSAVFTVIGAAAATLSAVDPVVINEFDTTPDKYPTILVRDATGNAVSGQVVTFNILSVGKGTGSPVCTLVPASPLNLTTNSDGAIVFDQTTLQYPENTSEPFSCLLLAQATSNGQPLGPLAVPLLIRPSGGLMWTGLAHDGSWTNAKNWDRGAAPTASTSVFIPLATTLQVTTQIQLPKLAAAASVSSIDVEDGGQVDLGGNTLTVSGNIDARSAGQITNGTVSGSGNGGVMSGILPNVTCSFGSYTISTLVNATGSVTNSGCVISVGKGNMLVAGNYTQNGGGGLGMGDPSGMLDITGDALFSANGETDFSNGLIAVHGNFTQSVNASAFATTFLQHTRMIPLTTGTRTVSFESPSSSKFIYLDLFVASDNPLTMATQFRVDSALTITAISGGTLSLPNGMVNTTNGPITVSGTGLTIGLGGTINARGLTFATNSAVTLAGTINSLALGNGRLIFQAGSHVTINATGTLSQPGAGCSRGSNVIIDGTNTQAVGILNQVCSPP